MASYFGTDASGNTGFQQFTPAQDATPVDYSDPEEQQKKKLLTDQQANALRQSGKSGSNAVAQSIAAANQLMGGINSRMNQYAAPDYSG